MRRLIGTATDDGRRRRGGRRVCRSGFQAGIGSGFLLDRRLLVDREELAFLAKSNAVFAAAVGIIGGHQTSNLSSPAMYYLVSYTAYLNTSQQKRLTTCDRCAMVAQLVALLVRASGRGGRGRVHGEGVGGHGFDHGGHRRKRTRLEKSRGWRIPGHAVGVAV